MEFDDELKVLVGQAEKYARGLLRDSVRDLTDLIAETLEDPATALDFETENLAIGKILMALNVLDAVTVLRDDFLDNDAATLDSVRVRRNLNAMQSALRDGFASGDLEDRGCVYVAWSGRPKVFLYVGKAIAASTRLELSSHGKLANALASATWLSLLYPAKKSEQAVLELEASIIEAHWGAFGKLPELNQRRGNVPMKAPEWTQVEALSGYFGRLCKLLEI